MRFFEQCSFDMHFMTLVFKKVFQAFWKSALVVRLVPDPGFMQIIDLFLLSNHSVGQLPEKSLILGGIRETIFLL